MGVSEGIFLATEIKALVGKHLLPGLDECGTFNSFFHIYEVLLEVVGSLEVVLYRHVLVLTVGGPHFAEAGVSLGLLLCDF